MFLNHRTREHELAVEGLEALQFSSRLLSDLLETQAKKRPLKAEMT